MPSHYLEPLQKLADERRVVIYDQMGTGRSEAPSDTSLLVLETFVDDLQLLATHLEIDRFHLLGHSWGGTVALAYAARHPSRVASLIMSSPLVDVARWCADAEVLIDRLPAETRLALRDPDSVGYPEAEAEFYRRHFCKLDPWPAELRRTMDELSTLCYETMWGPNEFTLAGTLAGVDLSPGVATLTMPSLWLCGSDDEARPETIRGYAQMTRFGEFVEFVGASHCAHLEQPDVYLSTVSAFLRSASTSTPIGSA